MDKKTDAEYIESIRRGVASSRRAAIIYLCVGLVLLVGGAVLVYLVQRLLVAMASDQATVGLTLGVALGVKLGLIAFAVVGWIAEGIILLRGNRTEELLLKYYDLASKDGLATGLEPPDGSVASMPSEGGRREPE